MEHTQSSRGPRGRTPLYIPESFARRQRLRAIAVGCEDLYEPPNTAEAFVRLENAIDEVKFDGTRSDGKAGEEFTVRRQRLKAIVATCKDLYEPPNTVEAFARIEAAIDEVKRHGTTSEAPSGDERMLDPPTTTERFNRIETAIDEMLARPNTTIENPWRLRKSTTDPFLSTQGADLDHKERAHLLRKRQLAWVDQRIPANWNHSEIPSLEGSRSAGLPCRPHASSPTESPMRPRSEVYRPSNDYNQTAGQIDSPLHSVIELPILKAGVADEAHHDTDIFRDDDAVQAFADQTYESARERYFGATNEQRMWYALASGRTVGTHVTVILAVRCSTSQGFLRHHLICLTIWKTSRLEIR